MSEPPVTPHGSASPKRPGPLPTSSLSDIGSEIAPDYNPAPSRTVPPVEMTIDHETSERNRYPPLGTEHSPLNTPETGLEMSMGYNAGPGDRENEGTTSPIGLEKLGALRLADDGQDQTYTSKRGSKSRFAFDLEPPMEVSIPRPEWTSTAYLPNLRWDRRPDQSPIKRHDGRRR